MKCQSVFSGNYHQFVFCGISLEISKGLTLQHSPEQESVGSIFFRHLKDKYFLETFVIF